MPPGLVMQQREGEDSAKRLGYFSRPALGLVESRLLCTALFLAAAPPSLASVAVGEACEVDFVQVVMLSLWVVVE